MIEYKKPSLTVDIVIFNKKNEFLLVKRKNEPFKDYWVIPGGFVDYGETTDNAAIREAKEETGIDITIDKLFGVYSDPNRDPRGHTITIVYLAIGNIEDAKAGSDAAKAKIHSWNDLSSLELGFDHKKILDDVLNSLSKDKIC
ncbi:NUDIX domain-containing protein [Methanobrevibacter cuticularis]|uniref:NUDIX domain-containing protein n=1 Tax=Methanobrevibacter cuticularis TaxID=47311 RepID=UPI00083445A2|nr:NUDIX hydrolase [Methanobrevibacter cuticularis]